MFGVPLKFERDIVSRFVTPRGFWAQHDQTNLFSYYMKGKSERAITMMNDQHLFLFLRLVHSKFSRD